MSGLRSLLHPGSVALVGASGRAGSVGNSLLRRLNAGGFEGAIYAVNPSRFDAGPACWAASVESLPETPELAIVATPAAAVPEVIGQLAAKGTQVAVVITSGLTADNGLRAAMLDAAGPDLRIIGPNCLGVIMPHARLDAAFATCGAAPGRLALVSQSGALVTAMLDWAKARETGFSAVVSAGDMADVDLADLVSLFADDPNTDAIVLYVEAITHADAFIAAARAASARKPVIAIKAGRSAGAAVAVRSHTGAMVGSYDVYEAAFRSAGVVVVKTLGELFDAAETLCHLPPLDDGRLGIVTNGGGAGILAVDELLAEGGQVARLSEPTRQALQAELPALASIANPVDIMGDASPERYVAAVRALCADEGTDAILVLQCPTAVIDSVAAAEAVVRAAEEAAARGRRKPILACWLGESNAASVRHLLAAAGIPQFESPEDAIRGFCDLVNAGRARRHAATLAHDDFAEAGTAGARTIIACCRNEGRLWLNEVEAKALLEGFGIPVGRTRFAASERDVASAAADIPAPYAVKIVSPDILHKSDCGGVVLGCADTAAAARAAAEIRARISAALPAARISGFAVESMISRAHAHELILGINRDPTFGPVIMVGAGGKAAEVLNDKAVELPPLDHGLALDMIGRTRVGRLLRGYRDEPAADLDALAQALVGLSRIGIALPEVAELDINPLLVDPCGAIALDARIRIAPAAAAAPSGGEPSPQAIGKTVADATA